MKYTIIGDVHGRTVWRDIVQKESDSDKIIFLGDYVSTHYPQYISEDQEIEELYGVLDYKEQNKDKVVLLRGNHDLEGLNYHWARCYPKVRPQIAQYMRTKDVTGWFLNSTQWVYQIPDTNIICSHAGISKVWLENIKIWYKKEIGSDLTNIEDINKLEPSEMFAFTPDNYWDNSGYSETQPCVWIRPDTLYGNFLEEYIQVVGHTRDHDRIYKYERKLWCIDALGNYKDQPSEYLVIEDGEFKIRKYDRIRIIS